MLEIYSQNYLVVNQDDESTMTSPYTHQLTGTGAASTNYLFNYSHAEGGEPMPYLNIKGSRASGTATNTFISHMLGIHIFIFLNG